MPVQPRQAVCLTVTDRARHVDAVVLSDSHRAWCCETGKPRQRTSAPPSLAGSKPSRLGRARLNRCEAERWRDPYPRHLFVLMRKECACLSTRPGFAWRTGCVSARRRVVTSSLVGSTSPSSLALGRQPPDRPLSCGRDWLAVLLLWRKHWTKGTQRMVRP